MRTARVLVMALAAACSGQRPPPAPAPIVIASGRPEPEAPLPAEPSGGELRGELDASFGKNGVGLYERAPDEQRFSHLTPLDDGSIAAVGYAPFEGSADMVVAHVTANGTLDAGFGERGFLRIGDKHAFGQAARALAPQLRWRHVPVRREVGCSWPAGRVGGRVARPAKSSAPDAARVRPSSVHGLRAFARDSPRNACC